MAMDTPAGPGPGAAAQGESPGAGVVAEGADPGRFAGAAYGRPFRRYQALAFDAFEMGRARGRNRCYVVMPPGSGKTVVGLEIARRLGRLTVALGPNTAIQAQWMRQWADFGPPRPAGAGTTLDADVNVLTYQALCTLDPEAEVLDELVDRSGDAGDLTSGVAGAAEEEEAGPERADESALGARDRADAAAERARRRRLIARGGDREALLGLLHPNGRALFERIRAAGDVTLILDECHHLLELWGHLVTALVESLGDRVFVVGLTATPPGEMDTRELALYRGLFGHADFWVPTPAVVKEGELAPYQELAYLTEPLPHERDYITAQERRFAELTTRLVDPSFATRPFMDWVRARVVERAAPGGGRLSWERFERDEPDLATAAIRLLLSHGSALPEGARVGERHRRPPTADDWAVLVGDWCTGFLRHSEARADVDAWDEIRRALPSIGYVLARTGIRAYVSPVDRVLALSAAKGAAVQTILDLESRTLGSRLRALVLCDYERAGTVANAELRSILDPQAGSAGLVLTMLLADGATRPLEPVLLTGRTVACSRSTAVELTTWSSTEVPPRVAERLSSLALAGDVSRGPGWEDIVILDPDDAWWVPRNYVPLVTRFFEAGRSRCLVGTRGLLGEGWDARSVNVLVDLTTAATSTSVHQMRGRSLRLDSAMPRKVANNWDVVCIAPEHPKGAADYARFVRKHQAYYALTAGGEIECGVSHVDPVLSPFGPPDAAELPGLNARTLARIGQREAAYGQWGVGQPYRNVETDTVRVRFARPIGLPARGLLRHAPDMANALRARVAGFAAGGGLLAAGGAVAGLDPLAALAGGAGVAAVGAAWAGVTAAGHLRTLVPSDALEDLAAAIVVALAETGGIDGSLRPASLRVVVQPDGYYRCYLDGAGRDDSAAFAEALDQLLAPLDAPRYIIWRPAAETPGSRAAALGYLARRVVGRRGRRIWHAVPDYLAANRDRVAALERAWHRHVGHGSALFARDPEAMGVLALHRGENPMASETELRTLWT